mgnify:CR=1 FL=1
MSFNKLSLAAAIALCASTACLAQSGNTASRVATESGQASGHASAAAGYGVVASGQVTSAAVAVPLSVGGAVLGSAAVVSAGAAAGSMRAANAPIGQPLPVTDRVITTQPPNQALMKDRVTQ